MLAECFYLIQDKRIDLDFKQLLDKTENNPNMVIVSFNIDVLKLFTHTNLIEIHDQIIVATTKHLGAVLLTKDEDIKNSKEVEIIWD